MIIYNDGRRNPFGAADYKRLNDQKHLNIRTRTVKRITQGRNKVKKPSKKSSKKRSKSKKISAKNEKFLKSLGLKVKKR